MKINNPNQVGFPITINNKIEGDKIISKLKNLGWNLVDSIPPQGDDYPIVFLRMDFNKNYNWLWKIDGVNDFNAYQLEF
jgi:LEA14-like dessication related protein